MVNLLIPNNCNVNFVASKPLSKLADSISLSSVILYSHIRVGTCTAALKPMETKNCKSNEYNNKSIIESDITEDSTHSLLYKQGCYTFFPLKQLSSNW